MSDGPVRMGRRKLVPKSARAHVAALRRRIKEGLKIRQNTAGRDWRGIMRQQEVSSCMKV